MGLLRVVLTQYVLMSDEACTDASSLTVRVTIDPFLPDGLVDLINFLSRIASFPPDPRAAEDTEILSRRFGFGGTVDGEELRC